MRRVIALLAAPLLLAAAPAPDAAHGGPLTPTDIMGLHDVRDAQLSPDGRLALFTLLDRMATFSPERTSIWIVPTDGSAPARPFAAGVGVNENPRWSPDGQQVAFLSNRANPISGGGASGFRFTVKPGPAPGAPVDATPPTDPDTPGKPSRQLWLMPADGGEAVPLTASPNDVADLAWSPDGRRIAFLSADPDDPAERAAAAAKRDAVVVDRPTARTRLWVLDLAAHTARCVSPPDVTVSGMEWSPNGRRLAVRIAAGADINAFFYHSRVALLDPAAGTLGPTLLDHAASTPHWSPDGTRLLASEVLQPGFIGLAPRIVRVADGQVVRLGDDLPATLTEPAWTSDRRGVLALSFQGTRSHLIRLDAGTGRVTDLAVFPGEAAAFAVSRDGRRIVAAASAPDRPAELWTVANGTVRPLTRLNPQVAGWRLGQVKEISWRNAKDGQRVYGVLVTPPGYLPGTPIKTVVQVHGGPEWAWWAGWLGSWHEWAQLLATHGYAVLLPNPRGSDGQGTAFARAVGSDWGGMDYRDITDGVDLLVRSGIADSARLGIGGWSYGGFMAAWAITHDHRFKAAVAGAAPSDLAAFSTVTDTPDFPAGYFGPAADHLALLDAHSPARLLEDAAAPLLVLHGAEDTRVPPTLGLELYRGLRLLGKPAEMVRYPREPHWFHEAAHQADVQARVLAWFDQHL